MPLPSAGKYSSQSDFMQACMKEASKNKERPNEQNVAMCLDAWREAHGGKKPPSKDFPAELVAAWTRILAKAKADAEQDDDEDEKKPNGNDKDDDEKKKPKPGPEKLRQAKKDDDDDEDEDNAKKRPKFAADKKKADAKKDDDKKNDDEDDDDEKENGKKKKPKFGSDKEKQAEVARIIARWKELHGRAPRPGFINKIDILDTSTPASGESEEDFMDRCVDELTAGNSTLDESDAEDACQTTWDDFADMAEETEQVLDGQYESGDDGLVHKTHASADGMDFILSDATPDRFGDIVEPGGWDTKNFARNPIALFNHHPDWIVGSWKGLRVQDNALRGNLMLAPKGTSPRIDEIRALVEHGILKAVSVGFKPIESRPRKQQQAHEGGGFFGPQGGIIYSKAELVETSLVSIPANPNALAVAKSLHISKETQRLVFGEHANKDTGSASSSARNRAEHGSYRTRASIAEYGRTHPVVRGQTMILSQRIEDGEKHLVRLRDQLQDHLATVDDENPDDAAMAITEELTTKIGNAERNLASLKRAEERMSHSNGDGDGNGTRGEMMRTTADARIDARMKDYGPRPFGLAPKKVTAMDYLIRQGVIEAYRKVKGITLDDARQRLYGNDECTRAYVDFCTRAASAQAQTTVTGWAAELVQQVYGDFLQILVPTSVMPNLANLGLALTFGRAGRIVIPSRSATPSLAGSFVGEGQAIPVRQGAFTTQTLTPKKLGVITSWTREMDEHSIPAIEGVLRDSVAIDTGIAIDNVLMDNNAATMIRPAGLRNNVTGLTPTAGGGFNALVGDIKQLAGALLTATAGHIRVGTFLMNPQQVLSISLTQPPAAATPLFPFTDELAAGRLRSFRLIQSANVPLGMVIALDAADFVTVGAEAPRFEVSDQATLHFEDTAPTDITGGTPSPAVPVRSMFQTDSIALRLVWPLNWTLRRLGMVSWLTGVTW